MKPFESLLWFLLCGLAVTGSQSEKVETPAPNRGIPPDANNGKPPEIAPGHVAVPADDWTMCRGPASCNGVAAGSVSPPLTLKWKYAVEDGAFANSPVVQHDAVFAADLDGHLYCLDAERGVERWRFPTELGFVASPLVFNDTVYVGDLDGVFYAVDIHNGSEKWRFQSGAEIDSSANHYRDATRGDAILFGSQDATLYCLDAASGNLRWKLEIDDQIRCTPAIVEGRTFVAGCDAQLHLIDLGRGKAEGAVELAGPTGVTPAIVGPRAFLGTEGGLFYGIDWQKREVLWTFELKRGRAFRSSAAANASLVVAGTRDKRLLAWDVDDGTLRWEFVAKRDINASPVISGPFVYVGSDEGRLFALQAESGEKVWEYETGGKIEGSPAVARGHLYVATGKGEVLCFGPEAQNR